ncbi:MAG TPA: hypothetical protein VKR22_02970, partial [Acidimicrobiales bacterium]|nr:hypothetical protein [Acidimicrobiales bacterium]
WHGIGDDPGREGSPQPSILLVEDGARRTVAHGDVELTATLVSTDAVGMHVTVAPGGDGTPNLARA